MELKDAYDKFCDADIDDPICEDRWQELMKRSKTLLTKRLINNSITTFTVLSTSVVQVIFTIAQILKQPSDVRYLAVEIFDRFTIFHYAQLYEYVRKDIKTDLSKTNMRDRVCQRIETQILLRIMSCIQLASKMNSNIELGVSVLTYVEHLLLLLAQHNSKVDLEVMYTTIIQVVDITYLLHEEIYLLLFNKMTGRWEKSAEEK
ncbi:unnamed protein product [Timema podura]|uniref:Uncharacterized protein n=1 Tax=Timema podura TaxID=61482 RepID=A0ABN7NU25_TIMPD|nr:unnamed protein product [Timema podura]